MRRIRAERRSAGTLKRRPAPRPAAREEWEEIFRRAPIGVLVLGLLLFVLGAGLVLGGLLFLLSGRVDDATVLLVLFGGGPLAMYLALHFVARREWAWVAVVAMLGLTLFSSVVRVLGASVFPAVALTEIAVTGLVLAYLFRPRVRGVFEK